MGNPGQEKTEIKKITAVSSATSLAITATTYAHNTDDPILYSRFNKIKIYRSTSSGGTFSNIDTVAIQIESPAFQTVYDDTTGTTSHYYKVSYYNDVSTLESSLSDEIPGTGYGRTTVSYLIDSVLEEAMDKAEQVTTRSEVLRWANDCNDYVHDHPAAPRKGWEHWRTSVSLSTAASSETVSLTSLALPFDKLDHLNFNYVSGSTDITYKLRYIPLQQFIDDTEDNTADEDDKLQRFTLDYVNNNLRLFPVPDTTMSGKLGLHYVYLPSILNSEGDTLEIPNILIYHNYCMYRFYTKKDDRNRAREYKTECDRLILTLLKRQRREIGQPMSMEYRSSGLRGYFKY